MDAEEQPEAKPTKPASPADDYAINASCELKLEEMCALAARDAHFVAVLKDCECERRVTLAICEPCMDEVFGTSSMKCVECGQRWTPATDAIEDIVRVRS